MKATVLGHEIFYTTSGQGPALVLLHGGPGLDHTYLRPFIDPLGELRTLVFYDQLGNGRSERPASLTGGLDVWVDELEALREHFKLERVALLGHSFGSYIALHYALRFPTRVSGLLLASSTPAFDYPEAIVAAMQARGTPQQLETFQRASMVGAVDDEEMRRDWMTLLPLYFHAYDPAVGAAMDERTHYSALAFNHGFQRCLPSYNVTARLAEITAPTLVVTGESDIITPPALGAARLGAGIPGAKVEILEQCGHFPFIEANRRFLDVARPFLAGLR